MTMNTDVSSLVTNAFTASGALPLVLRTNTSFPSRAQSDALGASLLVMWQHADLMPQKINNIASQLIWPSPGLQKSLFSFAAADLQPNSAVCTPGLMSFDEYAATTGFVVAYEDTAVVSVVPTGPPLYDPAATYGVMTPGRIATATSCGLTVARDFLDAARLGEAVWHWAVDQPPTASNAGQCVRMNTATGRWHADDCSRALPFACVRPVTSTMVGMSARVGIWRASPTSAAWAPTAGGAACPIGFTHSMPVNMLQNNALRAFAAGAGVADLWLDYHRPASQWTPFYARDMNIGAGMAPTVGGTTPAAAPIVPVTMPPTTRSGIVYTNPAGFPVTNSANGTYVVPVQTVSATGTDRFGNPATATRTNPVVTGSDGLPETVAPGVAKTEPNGLPPAPTGQPGRKQFATGFDNSTIFGNKKPPVVADLPAKPATSLRYAFFTPAENEKGQQKDEFCLPDARGACRWEQYGESVLWPSVVPLVLAALAFPLCCCGFWVAWGCCMSGSEPAEENCCPQNYFDDTGNYYQSNQVKLVMMTLIVMSLVCAIITIPVLVGTAGVRSSEVQVTTTFDTFVLDFKGKVVDLASQLLSLRELTSRDPGREGVLRDRIIAEVNRQANTSQQTTVMVREIDAQRNSATLAIMILLLLSLLICGVGGGVLRSIPLSYCFGCCGFIFICLCWLLFAVHYAPAVALADFCEVYAKENNPNVGIGGLLRDTIYCESLQVQQVLQQISNDYVNTGSVLCAAADRECARRDSPCANQPQQRTCARIDCSEAPPYDSNNTCTVGRLVQFGRNSVTDYGSGCPAGNASFTVSRCDNDIRSCPNSAIPCDPQPVVLDDCSSQCRNTELRNVSVQLRNSAIAMQRVNDTLALLYEVVACNYSEALREQIGTVACGDMYRSLSMIYVPCAVLGMFLVVPVIMAIKGIKRFNRDYWKPVAAHQRPPGRFTVGRRRFPGAQLRNDDQKEPLRPRRNTGHAGGVRPRAVSPAVAAMKASANNNNNNDAEPKARPVEKSNGGDDAEKPLRMSTLDLKARKMLNRQTSPPKAATRDPIDDDDGEGAELRALAASNPELLVAPAKADRRKTVATTADVVKKQEAAQKAAFAEKQKQRHSMAPGAVKSDSALQARAKPRTATAIATTLPVVGDIEPSGRYDDLHDAGVGDDIFDAVMAPPHFENSSLASSSGGNDDEPPPPAIPRSLSASSVSGEDELPQVPVMDGDFDLTESSD
jgi:hypothetical protein